MIIGMVMDDDPWLYLYDSVSPISNKLNETIEQIFVVNEMLKKRT